MVRRYKISQVAMEQALAADDARLQKRAELSIRVTKLADLAYDDQRGQCDWESVTRDMGMPLIECLRLFDPSLSTFSVRSLPNITDWLANDLSTLKSLVSEQFGAVTADEWPLVGIYMNVEQADCFMAHTMCTFPQMTPDLHEAITRHRNANMEWKNIFEKHPLFSCISGLRNAYYEFKEPGDSKLKAIYSEWTVTDTCRIQELVQTYYKPENQREVLIQAQMAFPNRLQQSIINKIKCTLHNWNADDVARLVHLVSTYKRGEIDWAAIGKDLGRTADLCHLKHDQLDRGNFKPTVEHSQTVSREVQNQYEQQQSVDWAEIAQQLNLSERECLEANQFNTGKAQWIYHPDTFSWDMANRMKTFIKDNYPKPLPVNYTAVSNYMWIVMSDCVKMASLLRGEMAWTPETIAQVVELRKQGMIYKDIARQLSPVLNKSKVVAAYYGHIKSKVNAPLTCKEKHRIKELVDTHAEQMSFTELRALVFPQAAS
ncbi:hypothetical protein IW141_002669 [Coemansia sp. RSA 355]|nr:hypothetical protein IW141_002669 [Coemansia sp. RSA 355]